MQPLPHTISIPMPMPYPYPSHPLFLCPVLVTRCFHLCLFLFRDLIMGMSASTSAFFHYRRGLVFRGSCFTLTSSNTKLDVLMFLFLTHVLSDGNVCCTLMDFSVLFSLVYSVHCFSVLMYLCTRSRG